MFDDHRFYLSVVIIFLVVACIAVFGGASLADYYAKKVISGQYGRLAYCELRPKADIDVSVRQSFENMTEAKRVRMIYQGKKMVYLFVVPQSPGDDNGSKSSTQKRFGEHLSLHRDDLSHCRVFSAFSLSTD